MVISSETLILHVAVNGNDNWSGHFPIPDCTNTDGPLASIEGAKKRIRCIRDAGMNERPVEVFVHEGAYEITSTIHFSINDLGDANTPILFKTAGDGEVRLVGGMRITGFKPHKAGVLKLSMAEYSYRGLDIKQLFYKGERQTLARYPKKDKDNPYFGGYLYIGGSAVNSFEDGHGSRDRFICSDPELKRWEKHEKIEVFVYPRYNYTNDIIPVKHYDPKTGEVILERPSIYEFYPLDRYFFRNVEEALTEPGEWFYDKEREILYFYPPEESDEEVVAEIPLVENLIELNGHKMKDEDLYLEKIDWKDGSGLIWQVEKPQMVKKDGYVKFSGFIMEGCSGAAVVARNVYSCTVEGCTVRNTGGAGLVVLGGGGCSVSDCDIYETSSHGVYISGGIRSTFAAKYEPCGHEIVNNYIHHMGATYKSVAGVAINGVGIKVAHNLIHDGPRWGILSRGNDNIIEYNHIRHVNIETGDTAGIYLVDRDFSMRGTKIRYNKIHDVLGYDCIEGVWQSPAFAFGIYLDDLTSGVEIYGNLIYRTPCAGIYIHAGQDNLVANNMLLDSTYETALFTRWQEDQEYSFTGTRGLSMRGNVFRNNILVSNKDTAYAYKIANVLFEEDKTNHKGNQWKDNIFWYGRKPVYFHFLYHNGEKMEIDFENWMKIGVETGSAVLDPMLEDMEHDCFALKTDSPAYKMGFKPIPLNKIGPYNSGKRASWPICEARGIREQKL